MKLDSAERKNAYTLFIRVVFNIKRLIAKVSGGDRVIGNLAAGLLLMKENYGVSEKNMEKVLKKLNIDTLDFMTENTKWFVAENKMLSPGVYTVQSEKIINSSFEEIVKRNDKIRVKEDCYPKELDTGELQKKCMEIVESWNDLHKDKKIEDVDIVYDSDGKIILKQFT